MIEYKIRKPVMNESYLLQFLAQQSRMGWEVVNIYAMGYFSPPASDDAQYPWWILFKKGSRSAENGI